ncbi:MAG: CCA tRNA nucleotidyltransferase [Candidatus Omnitrophica bacterium]|nr:CCA tRNA nucleotidyltransferase [Candidatus Omnitrophota bacterium]
MLTQAKKFPVEIRALILLASDIADSNDMSAYLVGGPVRDMILGVKNLDLDIVIEGDGIAFAELFAAATGSRLIRHKRFGTATVEVPRGRLKIDVSSARKEFYPEPAHLPVVSAGTLKDDLKRRDFTVNSMAISINKKNFGELLDFFGGSDDLRKKKIRVLHDLSFIDDPTRILRAVRFEQRYDFRLDKRTEKLLKQAIRLKMLDKVQPQRLRDELVLILKEGTAQKQLRRLGELSGFRFIDSGLSDLKINHRALSSVPSEVAFFNKLLPRHRHLDIWLVYFMLLIDALSLEKSKAVCKKFAFRRGEEKRILSFKKNYAALVKRLSRDKVTPYGIFTLLEPLTYEVIICLLVNSGNRNLRGHIGVFLKKYHRLRIRISGDDLRDLGITPGPKYQEIFRKVLKYRLSSKVNTRAQELALAKKVAGV